MCNKQKNSYMWLCWVKGGLVERIFGQWLKIVFGIAYVLKDAFGASLCSLKYAYNFYWKFLYDIVQRKGMVLRCGVLGNECCE